jgi:hypothetical protein
MATKQTQRKVDFGKLMHHGEQRAGFEGIAFLFDLGYGTLR